MCICIIKETIFKVYFTTYTTAGYQYDKETDLYYLNARYYDSKIARFISEDTYTGNASDPLSLNLYTYCHNEPIRYVDPSGNTEANLNDLALASNADKNDIKWNGKDPKTGKSSATVTVNGITQTIIVGEKGTYIKDNRIVIDNEVFNHLFVNTKKNSNVVISINTTVTSSKITATQTVTYNGSIMAQHTYSAQENNFNKGTGKTGGVTIGPGNGMGLPIDLYDSAIDSKYDNMSQDRLMQLTMLWYSCETKEQEEKILNKLSDFRDFLDSKSGKVLTNLTKITDSIDGFITESTMALMAAGFHFPTEWSELTMQQRIVAETAEIDVLETRYLKINLQLFAKKEAGANELVLKGSYSTPYTQRIQATYQNFKDANVDITEHGLNRVLGRASRGVTVENTIDTYKSGKRYYDPQENTYIKFKDGVAVSYDINSGKIVNVQTQSKPAGRWEPK